MLRIVLAVVILIYAAAFANAKELHFITVSGNYSDKQMLFLAKKIAVIPADDTIILRFEHFVGETLILAYALEATQANVYCDVMPTVDLPSIILNHTYCTNQPEESADIVHK